MSINSNKIIQAAQEVRKHAHAPYSQYKVGAAIKTDSGEIITGCNMESSSYGLTICAERVAIASAITQGHRKFKSLAIVTDDGAAPCGACRQVIWDICNNIEIILVDKSGNVNSMQSEDLLPYPFDDSNLNL